MCLIWPQPSGFRAFRPSDLVLWPSASTSVTGVTNLLGCFGAPWHTACLAKQWLSLLLWAPYCSGFLSVPCSFLGKHCGRYQDLGGVGWAGQEWAAVGSRVLDLLLHPHSSSHGKQLCFPPFLNIVVLPKTSLGGEGKVKYETITLLSECCHFFSRLLADTQDGKGRTADNGENQNTSKIWVEVWVLFKFCKT